MFRIKAKRINKNEYIIEILDGDDVVQTKLATNILDRDKLVFELCDMHNIVDVEYINMEKILDKTILDEQIPIIPYTDVFELSNYFDANSKYVFDRILDAVEDGILTKKKKIKLFQINSSGIFVDSLKRDWPNGLRIAHEYFLEGEHYDQCRRCVTLLKKLKATL